jgi:hypothetical protein
MHDAAIMMSDADERPSRIAIDPDNMSTDRIIDEDSRALIEAQLRWPAARESLLAVEGPPLSLHHVAALLGTDEQTVERTRQKRQIVGVPDGEDGFIYPRWQFGTHGPLPGFRELADALRDDDPWTLVAFVLAPNPRLSDETPLDVLLRGDVVGVLRAASAYGEHGAA